MCYSTLVTLGQTALVTAIVFKAERIIRKPRLCASLESIESGVLRALPSPFKYTLSSLAVFLCISLLKASL